MTTYAISNKKSGAVQGATNVKSTVGDSALTKNTPKATSPRMAVDIRGIFKKVSFLGFQTVEHCCLDASACFSAL